MEEYIKSQLGASLRYLPISLAQYHFKKKTSPEVARFFDKTGGRIHGICRPDKNIAQLQEAGIRWIRHGISFPFDKNGNIREEYLRTKQDLSDYTEAGLKVMAITSSVGCYLEAGIDPRDPKNEKRIRDIAVFLVNDLKDVVHGFQITNEIGIPRFGYPLKMDEKIRFMGIQAAAMAPYKGNIVVGVNSAGPQADQYLKLRPWYQYLDFVGLDIYIGCFAPIVTQLGIFEVLLKYLWAFTGKPVILMEFGYLAGGEPKTKEEKQAILRKFGAENRKDARKNMEAFVKKLPKDSQDYIERCASGDKGKFVFGIEFKNHLFCELPKLVRIKGCPHTQEGQAEFFRRLLPKLENLPFLGGAFIYCHKDDARCGICGQTECPVETQWGIVSHEGTPKKGYEAVKQIWNP